MKAMFAGLLAGLITLAAPALQAQALDRADPADLGFSAEKLDAMDAAIRARIDSGAFPGAVVLVARGGKVAHLTAMGAQTEGGGPMPEDAIFRIYSMTKPIVSVAAMMLVEEGRLDLSFPVAAYIPEFKDMQVIGEDGQTEPAKRPMTVQDLLRHTAGLTYGFFGAGKAREALNAENIESAGDNMAVARLLARLPLEHQPGTVWEYSRATDVLGAVIEVVEGKSLGEVLKARILDPLGMEDTGFWVADEAKRGRLAEAKADDRKIGQFDMFDAGAKRPFESGGGGMVSTAQDYARFALMLLNGGELDGVRILSPATVSYMTSDHMDGLIKPGKYYLPGPGYGFGLGFGVRLAEGVSPYMGSPGDYYWGGAAGTYFWVDPAEDLFVVYMMQAPKERVPMRSLLRNMVYGAMTDSAAGQH